MLRIEIYTMKAKKTHMLLFCLFVCLFKDTCCSSQSNLVSSRRDGWLWEGERGEGWGGGGRGVGGGVKRIIRHV